MKLSRLILISLSIFGISLVYSNVAQGKDLNNSSTNSLSQVDTSIIANSNKDDSGESLGGQVVESGPYHLEFVPEKESNGTHLDLYLQKGDTHEAIPNAKVTALVQSPDGKQQSLNLTYDAEEKHYTVLFPGTTIGQYQVKITADASGENVNGRFSFQQ
ncbi:MAG: hypothetical protein KME09_20715 [Pleurocapsa minor HA4230-MV1]|nr:hypothetical protein [Pleurocapsa minor HA4230-MV1]